MKKEYGTTIELPVVPFIVVVGFLLVLIIEQTVGPVQRIIGMIKKFCKTAIAPIEMDMRVYSNAKMKIDSN